MSSFILWYLVVSVIGLAAFPLVHALLPALPGRGYAFVRTAGILLWGFVFWLLGSYGLLQNNPGGMFFALAVVIGLSIWALYKTGIENILEWVRENKKYILGVELLFFAAFLGWTLVRFADPNITHTEKPMELAFINAIMKSPQFPPNDPWLSGYAISYYYFGYVMTAMLAGVTGISSGISFNLGLALVFGLAAVGAYGVVYNLLALRRKEGGGSSLFFAIFGPLYILLVSNLGGFLDLLHARGVGWAASPEGNLVSGFWPWLDMKELSQPPAVPLAETPNRFLWWWRSSRVLADYDFNGNFREVIDEFPFFSFILGDLHPHVITIPFVMLAIALSLNVFLGGGKGETGFWRIKLYLNPVTLLASGVILGALGFLNTWDFPIYVAVFSGAYVLSRVRENGWDPDRFWDFIQLAVTVGILGILFYFPFYISFSSQAGGILPNLINPTRGAHLWVMFGTLLLPLLAYLLYTWRREGGGNGLMWVTVVGLGLGIIAIAAISNLNSGLQILAAWNNLGVLITIVALLLLIIPLYFWKPVGAGKAVKQGAGIVLGFSGLLWLFSLVLGGAISVIPAMGDLPVIGDLFVQSLNGAPDRAALFTESLSRRFTTPGGWGTILLTLVLVTTLLVWMTRRQDTEADENPVERALSLDLFPILLILVGGLLVLAPEFVYLRDNFNTRMNTIFKFYYQVWILWGLGAAYGTSVLLRELRGVWSGVATVGIVLVLGIGLTYPILGLQTKTNGFAFTGQLDGTLTHTVYLTEDDQVAVEWLKDAPLGAIAEAVGGQYSVAGRISAHSGMPAVLGWPGHEGQWRGGYVEVGSREADINTIYNSSNWSDTMELLDRYDIRYIYIGSLERSTYRVNETKFQRNLEPIFQSGQVTIYEVPQGG